MNTLTWIVSELVAYAESARRAWQCMRNGHLMLADIDAAKCVHCGTCWPWRD